MKRNRVEKLQNSLASESVTIANNIGDKSADADKHLKERMPTIKCECGAEILMLPDLPAMNRAIKTHANEHRKRKRSEQSNISQLLSQLSLIKISAQNDA